MNSLIKGRPTFCTIDVNALRWNFEQAQTKVGPGVRILSVVKANAYGHGACKVASVLEKAGCTAFGVATMEEGIELRRAEVQGLILVLAGVYPEQLDEMIEHRLTPALSDLEVMRRFNALATKRSLSLPFHLKVDTGMGRIGLSASEIDAWLPQLRKLNALKPEGVFSHFSHAESVEGSYTRTQLELFNRVLQSLKRENSEPKHVHLANSTAVIALAEAHFNMVRPGLMLYGVHPSAAMRSRISLKPALSWRTRITQLKRVPKGSSISYGQTFVTQRESLIATLPVGYADGYHRLFSNRAAVLARGQRAPVVGAVCMDLTMVDVTDIPSVQSGDEVVLLGSQGKQTISATEMASWANTISYEIFTSIGARVPRVYGAFSEEKTLEE
jgi:alanine racemase